MGEQLGGGYVAEDEPDRMGYVYFIRCRATRFMRIGWSLDNPESRFLLTEAYSPTPVERVAVMRGTQRDEGRLHELFAASRDHAEWFRPSEAIEDYAADYGSEWVAGAIGFGRRQRPIVITDEESQYWMTGSGPKPPERTFGSGKRRKPHERADVVEAEPAASEKYAASPRSRRLRYGPLRALLADAAKVELPPRSYLLDAAREEPSC